MNDVKSKFMNINDQKDYVLRKLGHFKDLRRENIFVDRIDSMGWQAIIRTEDIDFVFTYYDENSWKIESFPVYAMSRNTFRSTLIHEDDNHIPRID